MQGTFSVVKFCGGERRIILIFITDHSYGNSYDETNTFYARIILDQKGLAVKKAS